MTEAPAQLLTCVNEPYPTDCGCTECLKSHIAIAELLIHLARYRHFHPGRVLIAAVRATVDFASFHIEEGRDQAAIAGLKDLIDRRLAHARVASAAIEAQGAHRQ